MNLAITDNAAAYGAAELEFAKGLIATISDDPDSVDLARTAIALAELVIGATAAQGEGNNAPAAFFARGDSLAEVEITLLVDDGIPGHEQFLIA